MLYRTLAAALALLAVLGARDRAAGQACDPLLAACGLENDPGERGIYDDSVTDLAYSAEDDELWAIEGPFPGLNNLLVSRFTVFSGALARKRSLDAAFSEPAFGIEKIPSHHEPAAGAHFYVLVPGEIQPQGFVAFPRIGLMDRDGVLVSQAFTPVIDPRTSNSPPGFYSALDAHPSEQELVLLDDGTTNGGRVQLLFVDLSFQVTRGPFPAVGSGLYYAGGVTYGSASSVLVLSQFDDMFQGRLALEYDIQTGAYTQRLVLLDALGGERQLPLGIEVGRLEDHPALFAYDALLDAVYALPLPPEALVPAPGPVQDLAPSCFTDAGGHAVLTWKNDSRYSYDRILVLENGVVIAALPPDATEYRAPAPVAGKIELCLQTRAGDRANEIRACCEGQSGQPVPFLPDARSTARLDLDPLNGSPHFPLGLACRPLVDRTQDFRLFLLGSYDNQVRVVDSSFQVVQTIATAPERLSRLGVGGVISDLAANGIALLDLEMAGRTVPMYALLDTDGDEDSVPRASVHFLEDTSLPDNPPFRAGDRFGADMPIERLGEGVRFLAEWDTDAIGDLITLDSDARSVLRIRYDPDANTMRVIAEAPLPIGDLTPFPGRAFPQGGISVLPSGHYLVAAGDSFDRTLTRAFLLTPFAGDPASPDLEQSVKLVGQVEGLRTFVQLDPDLQLFGRAIGPDLSLGLETAFFRDRGAAGHGAGVILYDLPHLFPAPSLGFRGNFLVALGGEAVDPDLAAERLEDSQVALGPASTFRTSSLRSLQAGQRGAATYHVLLGNVSTSAALPLDVKVHLGGVEEASLRETGVVIAPGRSLYRRIPAQPGQDLVLELIHSEARPDAVRLIVGATALAPGGPAFRRGDVNDDGATDVSDAVFALSFQFLGGDEPACFDAADADDNGRLDITDPVYTLDALFRGGPPPLPPGPDDCGPDPTADELPACAASRCASTQR